MKSNFIAIIVGIIIIGTSYIFVDKNFSHKNTQSTNEVINNVRIVDGKQIIEIKAKGGFLPRKSIAKSGIPTILRLNTNGTFDCSSSVRIPSMKISKILPPTGITDIDLGTPNKTIIQGACGMGMYPFEIEFE